MKGKPLKRLKQDVSIRQHIHLIIRTHLGEYRYDPSFGCLVWNKDFDTIRSVNKWKEELLEAFTVSIKKFEHRLRNINVMVTLNDLKIQDPKTRKLKEVRKEIIIDVSAHVAQTNEIFHHKEHIYFSPLSLI